jgi:hypothetical protein
VTETVIARYRVQAEREPEFRALLARHWPALHRLELVTDVPARHFRRADQPAGSTTVDVVEIFEWVSAEAARVAHTHPEVSPIWERMGELTTEMEFPHFEELAV